MISIYSIYIQKNKQIKFLDRYPLQLHCSATAGDMKTKFLQHKQKYSCHKSAEYDLKPATNKVKRHIRSWLFSVKSNLKQHYFKKYHNSDSTNTTLTTPISLEVKYFQHKTVN